VTTREKAPTILTAEGARRLTARIRDALGAADNLLVQAWEGRAWEALNFPSWGAYVEREIPRYRLIKALPPEERAEEWAEQVRAGLSQGAVAEAAGVGKATVSRALVGKELPETARGLDGKVRSTRSTVPAWNGSPSPTPESRADQIVRLVAARGDRGATSPEIARMARCSQGAASGGLSRLHRQGRLRPTREQRGGFGIYVIKDS
jgi:hypothetical protein